MLVILLGLRLLTSALYNCVAKAGSKLCIGLCSVYTVINEAVAEHVSPQGRKSNSHLLPMSAVEPQTAEKRGLTEKKG